MSPHEFAVEVPSSRAPDFVGVKEQRRKARTEFSWVTQREFMVQPLSTDGGSGHELFVFVHVPKTGGQTLRKFFTEHLEFHKTFVHLGPAGIEDARRIGLAPFEDRPVQQRQQARVILGHEVTKDTHTLVPGTRVRHVLFLREPAATLVSYYNFQMKQLLRKGEPLMEFDQWYDRSKQDNMVTRWLLTHFLRQDYPQSITRREFDQVQSALKDFWFVGCTEHMDRDTPLLFERMGFGPSCRLERVNVAGLHYDKTMTLDAALRARLRAENPVDVELHEFWQERLPATLARIQAETQTKPIVQPVASNPSQCAAAG
jgi:hypothetical protein